MSDLTALFCRFTAPLLYKAMKLDVSKYSKWLKETEQWTSEQRAEWRLKRLNDIVKFSWEHVEFYREFWGDHGYNYQPLKSFDELEAIPILRKDMFKQHYEKIQPDNLDEIPHRGKATGGTTGQPVHYLQDFEHWTLMQAFINWGFERTGYRFGDQVGILAGGSLIPENTTFKGKFRCFIERKLFLFGVHMDEQLAVDYHQKLDQFGVKVLYGYPSIISMFSTILAEKNLKLPSLLGVVTTAEMLLPKYRENIEKNLECKVFNHLGGNDGGYLSFECSEHNGLHYCDLQSHLEVEKTDNDEMGKLLITNLWNQSTPFIRYENGDCVTLTDRKCACGSNFPLIESVQGRTMDILSFSNGRSLSGPALTLIFGPLKTDIYGWQVIQRTRDSLEVRVQCHEPLLEQDRDHINKVFGHHLGEDVELSILEVDELIKTKNGKLKPIWVELETEKV